MSVAVFMALLVWAIEVIVVWIPPVAILLLIASFINWKLPIDE